MRKILVPVIIGAILMAGLSLAMIPVERATTVHNTILAGTIGLGCATESVDIGAEIDNDIITFTFTQPIVLTTIIVDGAANMAGDTLGFDAVTVDDADVTTTATAEDLDDDPAVEIYNELDLLSIHVQAELALTADDDAAAGDALDANDDFDITFCGLTEDPEDFDGDDVTAAITEA
jgi:hypothetical protein